MTLVQTPSDTEPMATKELGKEIGKRQWHTARVKRFLGEPPRRYRLVEPSLADYIDGRLDRMALPDPLPPITGKDHHRGTIVWGERTWDLPIGPEEVRGTPARKSERIANAITAPEMYRPGGRSSFCRDRRRRSRGDGIRRES